MFGIKYINDAFCTILFLLVVIIVICITIIDYNAKITYYTYPTILDKTFQQQVRSIIASSLLSKKYKIKEVNNPNDAKITIELSSNEDLKNKFQDKQEFYPSGKPINFSYTFQGINTKPKIYINDQNWLNGIEESGLNLQQYRQYVILHEFMHGLGFDHQPCDETTAINGVCPIMYQSTRGCPTGYKCGYNPTDVDFTKKLGIRYL